MSLILRSNDADGPFWLNPKGTRDSGPIALSPHAYSGRHCGAIASGIGRGILPCFIGDSHGELRRSPPGDPVVSRDSWLLIHSEARESARVTVVANWLVERFTTDARLLSGLRDSSENPKSKSSARRSIGSARSTSPGRLGGV